MIGKLNHVGVATPSIDEAVKLYSDLLLQGFFVIVQLYGWRVWTRTAAIEGAVTVRLLGAAARIGGLAAIALATALWGALMHRYTDAALPWWDATIAMLSVAAQCLMSWRYVENWALWIAVNVVSIGVYAAKGLWPTAALYILLLGLSLWGLAKWVRAGHRAAA